MTPALYAMLRLLTRHVAVRLALERWALRFTAGLLRRFGPAHAPTADLLQVLGQARAEGHTMTGVPTPRAPARRIDPSTRSPLPRLHREEPATRPYLVQEDPNG